MRYLIALMIPPVAVGLCGYMMHSIFSVGVYLAAWLAIPIIGPFAGVIWFVGLVHALMVCSNYYADRRARELSALAAAAAASAAAAVGTVLKQSAPPAALPAARDVTPPPTPVAPKKKPFVDTSYDPETGRYSL